MKLTSELILRAPELINPCLDRELNLRGNKISYIENLGVTKDQYDTIDFSDNEIIKLENFPLLSRVKTLFFNNNHISRFEEDFGTSLPNLESLILSNNRVINLSDLEPLVSLPKLKYLSLLDNIVAKKQNYRLYLIYLMPKLKIIDFKKVKQTERDESRKIFGVSKSVLDKYKDKSSSKSTFVPGEGISNENGVKKNRHLTEKERSAILEAIDNAKSIDEINILENKLKNGEPLEIVHPVYTPKTGANPAMVSQYLIMTNTQLENLLDNSGGTGVNADMRKVVLDLATLYYNTANITYADKAKVLLKRYAVVIKQWPMTSYINGAQTPWNQVDFTRWDNGGFWATWFHMDLEESESLVLAYDFIYNTLDQSSRTEIESTFNYMCNMTLKNGNGVFDYSNMGGNFINGLIPFGRVVDPSIIHMVFSFLENFPFVGYFRDGIWHEGSPAYHLQISNRIFSFDFDDGHILELRNYTDPLGYQPRFVNNDYQSDVQVEYNRLWNAASFWALPNRKMEAVHDSQFDQTNWYAPYSMSTSRCMFGSRDCVIGEYKDKDQTRVRLHFGGSDGHEHGDCLNLGVWALGEEVLSEGGYSEFGNRDWVMSTPGHNTVVVDELNQRDRFDNHIPLTQYDLAHGLNRYFRYQDYGHGNTFNAGNIKLFHTTFPNVKVVESEAIRSIKSQSQVSVYQRFLSTVRTTSPSFYLVDIFRVKGGNIHDWMLHGNLGQDYTTVFSGITPTPVTTQLKRFNNYLNITSQFTMGQNPKVWKSTFTTSKTSLSTTHFSIPSSTLNVGRAPSMRRPGDATFLDIRTSHSSKETTFVAIHEPSNSTHTANILSVTPLTYTPNLSGSIVSLQIQLSGNRMDYIAHTLDQPPYPLRNITNSIAFKGRYAHVSIINGAVSTMYLLEGSYLEANNIVLSTGNINVPDFNHRGTVDSILRKRNGSSSDALVVRVNSVTIPEGTALSGTTITIQIPDSRTSNEPFANTRTEGFTIKSVEKLSSTVYTIHLNEDPGFEILQINSTTNIFKYRYYPSQGLPFSSTTNLTFFISGFVTRDSNGTIIKSSGIPI
eukprot:gene8622-10612_t